MGSNLNVAELEAKIAEVDQKIARRKAKIDADKAKVNELREKVQAIYRSDPAQLAKAIATEIRSEAERLRRTNVNLHDLVYSDRDEDLTGMRWYQGAWGQIMGKALGKEISGEINLDTVRSCFGGTRVDELNLFEAAATCGTTGCIAGWADSLAGYPMVATVDKSIKLDAPSNQNSVFQTDFCRVGNEIRQISDVAAELLHLDGDQREYLFSGERTERQVLSVLDEIASGNLEWKVPNYLTSL